ncbi:MlaD family protein [Rhodococcus qingshengii]|uniref:MlaD family protein n=1 Tax=Rhodococcus qingshengii TaxID=334542 RepID=UPI003657B671
MKTVMNRHKVAISGAALLLILATGISYLTFISLRINPFESHYGVTVHFDTSGGMQVGSDVTYRGASIGSVESVELDDHGVSARLLLSSNYPSIPAASSVHVKNLSAAGEQYVDLTSESSEGGYLHDGSVIDSSRTTTPTPFTEMLAHTSRVLDQLDPAAVSSVIHEIDTALGGGSDELVTAIEAADTLLSQLSSVLPQTMVLIANGRTTLKTISAIGPDTSIFAGNFEALARQMTAADAEIRRLFETTPANIDAAREVIGVRRSTTGDFLKTLGRVALQARLRAPALSLIAPNLARGLSAWGSVAYDGAFHVLADLAPRPTCEYDNPATAPAVPTNPLPLKYLYCTSSDPQVGQRGAQNAPRPPGDDTAGPPPGALPTERLGGN